MSLMTVVQMRIAKLQLCLTPAAIKHTPNLAKNLSSSIFGVAVFAVLEVISVFWFGERIPATLWLESLSITTMSQVSTIIAERQHRNDRHRPIEQSMT